MKRWICSVWCLLAFVAILGAKEPTVKVGSFNLCTSDSRKGFVEDGKKGFFAPPQRYWSKSATAVADMIVALDCDVLGVQEVCDSIWGVKGDYDIKRLVAERSKDFAWILYPNSTKGIQYDVAIAYKPSAVDTLATGIFWTGGHPDKPVSHAKEPRYICRPCVWAKMRHRASGREFWFFSAHTVTPQKYKDDKWPKGRGNVVNLQQLALCAPAIVPEGVPSVMVGDLNVDHKGKSWVHISEAIWEDVYTLCQQEGSLFPEDVQWGTQNTKDETGYSKWYPDHILINGMKVKDFAIIRDKYPTQDGSLHFPSDHLPITAELSFAKAPKEVKWESLRSPDGRISMEVRSTKEGVVYRVLSDGKVLVNPSPISMTLDDGTVLGKGKPKKIVRSAETMTLLFSDHSLDLRAFDDGVAWRWNSSRKDSFRVLDEQVSFRFPDIAQARVSYTHKNKSDPFQDDFENVYLVKRLPFFSGEKLAVPPVLVEAPGGEKLIFGEADGVRYPGLFLQVIGNRMEGRFAPYPRKEVRGGHNDLQMQVVEREDFIAYCESGARSFPWRVIGISRTDCDLAENNLMQRLSGPAVAGDFSWVKPGKVAWEWWNQFALTDVDFRPGINMPTYKAYIDFASRHGIEYVILDEGWAVKGANDLFAVVPELDLPELIGYARGRGVDVILWAGFSAFDKDMEKVCAHYAKMGVKGFKVDFLDRNDQKMMNFMYRAAETAARNRLLVDFHGCPPPTGLQKIFPNIINCEGIFGLEQMRKRPFPDSDMVVFDVTAPFIRFRTGPADYTPGAFLNSTPATFVNSTSSPMSQGTRCRQLAEYVVFDAPLQMLCDSPSRYEAEPDCADFLYRVPTVWDETRVLEGKVGEYIVTARRKGDTWYLGALTDWTPRKFTLDLSRLGLSGADIEAWEDGADADQKASSWKKNSFRSEGSFTIRLSPGGGWAGIVK